MTSFSDHTPLMRQYHEIKQRHQDTLLLFQVGDFYELFFDDAKKAAAYLGITLTKRGKINGEPIPLCGVPVHTLDHYVTKLIKGGFKVALCDQLTQPVPGKVVERGVTQVLTPGTLTDSKMLREKSASYLFSFFPAHDQWGLVFAELMTAQLFATVLPPQAHKGIDSELIRFFPDEIILPKIIEIKSFETYFKQNGYVTSLVAPGDYDPIYAQEWAAQRSQTASDNQSVTNALANFYHYLRATQQGALDQFKQLSYYQPDDFLLLDRATQQNLEIVRNANDGGKQYTLFDTIDAAVTPMGSRMIKKWVMRPLVKQKPIDQRLDAVEYFFNYPIVMQQLEEILKGIGDVERVIGRIALKRATLADYLHLKGVLESVPLTAGCLELSPAQVFFTAVKSCLIDFTALQGVLEKSLNDDSSQPWIIKNGFDPSLDRIRELVRNGTQEIMALELREQQATGINSLKIRFNSIQGYYIEITKTHVHAVPARYVRHQTLVGKERYTTAELDQLQQDMQRAHNQITTLEKEIFEQIKNEISISITPLRKLAHALANIDAVLGLARSSYNYGYVRPLFNQNQEIIIKQGRHPVVERVSDHSFIPNDTQLHNESSTWIITGPNMGGKSTYLRQVALINIMAQIGMFVPAQSASISLVDRIFTRIGAGDNLATGKSTFLVEMEETATICAQATYKSLVILDEVGRGTSTYDGLAIAQAVVEYIHTTIKARCLFATHYHELTLLAQSFEGMVTYHAASHKTSEGIQFLYKMQPGSATGSFGIDVARLAQLPSPIIERARTILASLQASSHGAATSNIQPATLVCEPDTLKELINTIDYDNLSPRQAFDILWKLKEVS